MSITGNERVTCLCGAPVEVTLAESINAARHPHLREMVLARTLHRFACGSCARTLVFEKALSYVDWDRRQLIQVAARGDLHRADVLADETRELRDRAFRVGPQAVQALKSSFFVRLCFGYEELREKLVAFDAGLDDGLLELVKCEVLAAEPAMADSGVLTLRLDAVEDDGSLRFVVERITPAAGPEVVTVQRALYDHLAGLPDEVKARRPRIENGPHVSLLRLFDWPKPSASGAAPVRRSLL